MKKLREILRLKFECHLKHRQIGRAVGISPSTVSYYTQAFHQGGLEWPSVNSMSDDDLILKLKPFCSQLKLKENNKQKPEFALMHQELKRKEVILMILYEEYKAGEKCFVDYAGPKFPIYDANSNKVHEAVIFIGVLGASNYTFAEAIMTRTIPDWLGSHQRMFEFFGGVPDMIIPDNEKAGVSSACYYDPELNPNYSAFAEHYHTSVLPTRPAHPRDKSKVETGVQIVERWILARLRHQKFFSLKALNSAIALLLVELNQKPFKKLLGCRQSQFETLDKPELKPLPNTPYEHAIINRVQVRLDYHIEADKHYYSVPHQLIGKIVEYRLTSNFLEIYYQGLRIASHVRSHQVGKHTVLQEHMPEAHRKHQAWTPQTFINWAETKGAYSLVVANAIIEKQPNPECCYRIHLGLCNLAKRFGGELFEKACKYASDKETYQFRSIKSILEKKLYQAVALDAANFEPKHHAHIRGADYYQP